MATSSSNASPYPVQASDPIPTVKIRRPRFGFSMRTKITFPFLVIAIALALGAAYVITNLVFDTIDSASKTSFWKVGFWQRLRWSRRSSACWR
jgi:hypothetical protein